MILDSASKVPVQKPAAYITTTISNDPHPERFLPTPTPARVA